MGAALARFLADMETATRRGLLDQLDGRATGARVTAPTRGTVRSFALDADDLAARVDATVKRYKLSPRMADTLSAAVAGVPRRYLAEALDITDHTVKSHVRSVIRRTGHRDLDELIWMIRSGPSLARPRRRAGRAAG